MARTQLVRVYLPLTSSLLRRAREEGAFGPAPLAAQAVTPALEAEVGDDEEECEYAAMTAASLDSLALLGPEDEPRRVVAAVDVSSWEPRGDEPGAVTVAHPVPWRRLAAVLVDGDEAVADVTAARGSAEEDLVERCLDHELAWFATQEVDQLLAGHGGQAPT